MRIVFIADARSATSRNWISYFVDRGHDVNIIATYPCLPNQIKGASLIEVPIAFSKLSRRGRPNNGKQANRRSLLDLSIDRVRTGTALGFLVAAWAWLSPIEINRHIRSIRGIIADLAPDVVHAMRIPFEGIAAAAATPPNTPLVVSVWGNDFTWIGGQNRLIASQTRRTVRRTDALVCDNVRDLRLATDTWGFDAAKPNVVLPGAGGIQTSTFYPGEPGSKLSSDLNVPSGALVVINPRGFRGYVQNETFFKAIPLVLEHQPDAYFLCCAMQNNATTERWLRKLNISHATRLLPVIPREQMADLFRLARVSVSPSVHDGTPNSLIEAMACGCVPVAGDIDSIREWITDGENGLLCDPTEPKSVAQMIVRALNDERLRNRAKEINLRLVHERADYDKVMPKAEEFYNLVIQHRVGSKSNLDIALSASQPRLG
jgi:glycosyltransferase involved in cell wall biosynthesis